MAAVIDELITEYVGKDKQSDVAERVAKANERLHGTIQKVVGALAALEVAERVLSLKSAAEDAALQFEELDARLTAIVGSAEKAAEKLRLVERVAGPSPFSTKQLADAAVMLEAFGLNSERTIPLIGRLGAAFGASDEQIDMFARALGQLSVGSMIDADVMAAMGLSRADFVEKGIKFDGSGALQSSAVEALSALEKIVLERYGGIFEQMADTAVARTASLQDSWDKVLRILGNGIMEAQGPFLDSWTKVLNALTQSGVLEEVIGKLTRAFTGVFGGDTSESVAAFAAKVLAFLDALPERVKLVADFIADVFNGLGEGIVKLYNTIGQSVTDSINQVYGKLKSDIEGLFGGKKGALGASLMGADMDQVVRFFSKADEIMNRRPFVGFGKPQYPAGDPRGDGRRGAAAGEKLLEFKPIENIGDIFGPILRKMPKMGDLLSGPREQEYFERLKRALANPGETGIPDTSGIPFLRKGAAGKSAEDQLSVIAANTERTARAGERQVDASRFLFGGGDLARSGVSLIDLSPRMPENAAGRARGGTIKVKVTEAASGLERSLLDLVRQVVSEIQSVMPAGVPLFEVE